MSGHPYGALRSITPPLYYRRPEGAAPSYYTVPAREVEGLRIASSHPAVATSTGGPTTTAGECPKPSSSLHPSMDRSSANCAHAATAPAPPPSPRLSSCLMPSVVNPYSQSTSQQPRMAHVAEPLNPASYLQQANAMGRWSYQQPPSQQPQYPTLDPVAARIAAIDAEEAAMAAEEMTLRAKLAELQVARKRQEEEQLYLSHGWAQMLETEERYYTEPVIDLRSEIMAREQQCAMLHSQLQQVEAQAQHVQSQLQGTEYILRDAESLELERKRVQDAFQDVERRRRECVARAERYFDVETKRVVEGNKAIRNLDNQLREMTQRGPLAPLQDSNCQPSSCRRSASRAVTFAADKSIVLDVGCEDAASSMEPVAIDNESGGMTNSYTSAHSVAPRDEGNAEYGVRGPPGDDIDGTSVSFSLNDTKDALMKRRRVEIASV
ncbi:hypothetical protein LSCM1_01588 [Leishmania martiniquensis]|uniref:Kinetoplastid kinetochore protein 8 n=1 Tax=Leishmania martiniquensis TaxID=1580590 RepID=A0A836GTC8_9TRYP|nr:hypothetical protein LSCM1_01588 [Leishmania martiniquensis]